MLRGSLAFALLLLAGSAAAADDPPAVLSYTPPPGTVTKGGPVLALPKTDWQAAGTAAGVRPDDGLAGDPNATPNYRLRPPPEADSYFNSVDWQKSQDAMSRHGHQGAVAQFRGMGEAAAMGAAQAAVGTAIGEALAGD